MPTAADAREFRSTLVALTDATVAELSAVWAGWSWDDPPAATAAALAVVPQVVWAYQDAASTIAADTYDEWRSSEGVPGRFRASPAALAEEDRVLAAVRNAVAPLWVASPDGTAARSLLEGAATRLVSRSAADTIIGSSNADPKSVGWSRITRSGACRFCRMLAGRGGVYRSEKTARFASHDHCHCAATPSWDADAPDMPVVAYVAAQRDQTPADRARVRAYLDANFPE